MKRIYDLAIGWRLCLAGSLALGPMRAHGSDANPFPCGQCTAAAYTYWVGVLGQSAAPSFRAARYWYDDAPAFGFQRGTTAQPRSLLVLDAWPTNRMGHVGVVWLTVPGWYGDWELLWLVHRNWSPRTDGICDAPVRSDWFAYNSQTQTVKYWNGAAWSQHYPVKGFVYPRPAAILATQPVERTGRRRG